ncbi:MAG TPA: hypothetical protein VL334_16865 [Anaerolineae bacterium]|nr:hypothetical protein [Anaerolineae bacterium]
MRVNGNAQHEDASLQQAILQTLVYADLFDYPLTPNEVVRYLGVSAEPATILEQLDQSAARGMLVRHNGYVALPGRDGLFALRARREQVAASQWPVARRYAHWLALTPFVRMVAVTGTLAVNNVEAADDIDLFIVTRPGRLWLCRALVILLVRLAALAGDELCPNYFLSEQRLAFDDRTLFAAREVTQMAPLYGPDVYWRIRQLNAWVGDFLPQAGALPQPNHYRGPRGETWIEPGRLEQAIKQAAEALLGGALGARLERWEMERKVRKFNTMAQSRGGSVVFTTDVCKGHFDRHDQRILREFEAELAHYGLRET